MVPRRNLVLDKKRTITAAELLATGSRIAFGPPPSSIFTVLSSELATRSQGPPPPKALPAFRPNHSQGSTMLDYCAWQSLTLTRRAQAILVFFASLVHNYPIGSNFPTESVLFYKSRSPYCNGCGSFFHGLGRPLVLVGP